MTLAIRPIHIPAGRPINESLRPEFIEAGDANLGNENVRQDARGALRTRWGFGTLGLSRFDGSSRAAGYKVFSDAFSTSVIDGSTIDVYDTAATKWRNAGRVCEAGSTLTDLPSVGMSTYVYDIESCNGYLVSSSSSASDSTGVPYASVTHIATGSIVSAPVALTTANFVAYVGSFSNRYFVAFAGNGSTGVINAYILDTQAIGTGWTLLAAVTASWAFGSGGRDVGMAVCSLSDRVAIAYSTNSGTDRVTIKTYDQTGLLETATVPTTSTTPDCIDLNGSNADTLWVSWNEGQNIKIKGVTGNSLATVKATTATIITTVARNPSQIKIACSATAGKGRLGVVWNALLSNAPAATLMRGFKTTTGAAATDGSQITVYHSTAIGRPITVNGRYYMVFLPDASVGTVRGAAPVLCDWTDDVTYLRPVANPTPGLLVFGSVVGKIVAGSSATKWLFGFSVTRSQVATVGQLLEVDFGDSRRWQTVRHGRSVFMTGAISTYCDGVRTQEVGFLAAPPIPDATTSGTGISLTVGRRYVCVYEDVDGDGNWIVSGISNPSPSTGAVANKTISVTTAPLTISYRASGPSLRVVLYATLDGAVPPYYRHSTVLNDTTNGIVTFTDVSTDATLGTNAKLYAPNLPGAITGGTVGESLDRRAPTGAMHLASYNGMLVGAAGSVLYPSGQPVDGEATWFSPVLQVPVTEGEGDITGLVVQDGTLFVFKRRTVFAVAGEIPSDNGQSGGLGAPRRLAVDVGCIDPRSLVVTSLGIFFQSERGIEILNRGQGTEFLGEAVKVTTAAFPVCTSATLDASANVVYFDMASAETANQVSGTGRTLVFDLTLKTWVSKDRRKNNAGTSDTPAQSACMTWTGSVWRYAWLGTDARLYVEDRTTYLDVGAFVTPLWETPVVKLGLNAEQRMTDGMLLVDQASAAGLKVECAYDWATYAGADDKTWTEAAALGKKQFPLRPKPLHRAKFRVSATAPAVLGTGQGFTFLGLTFDVAPKSGSTTSLPHVATADRR